MAALTSYTSYAEVRAALGVSDKELPDAVLALGLYALSLERSLDKVATGVRAGFAAVAAIAEGSRTDNQAALYAAVKLFAPYAVAHELASGAPLFAVKSVTDGKAGFVRDSTAPYKEALASVEERYSEYAAYLADAFSIYSGGSAIEDTPPSFLTIAIPQTDPVIGG